MIGGFIKIHRCIMDSYLWTMPDSHLKVAIMCISLANWKESEMFTSGNRVTIPRGSFVTSLASLHEKSAQKRRSKLSIQQIRTSLLNLERAHFLTNVSTKQYRVISIINYDAYQCGEGETNNQPNKRPTNDQQTANNDRRTSKNSKKEKKETFVGQASLASTVVGHLNSVTGRKHSPDSIATKRLLQALANQGATAEQLIAVIDAKAAEWLGNPEMRNRICPATLFASLNFWKYADELAAGPTTAAAAPERDGYRVEDGYV